MKSLNRLLLASFILIAICISACKDAYLTDGGVYNAVTKLSNYEYLKSNGKFDTLIILVDHFNLKDSLEKASTFYAFTDYTAATFIKQLKVESIEQLYDSISSKFITQFMFPERVMVSDVLVNPVIYENWAEPDSANCAISKAEYIENIYLTNSAPGFKYYQMQYLNVKGEIDNTVNASPGDPVDITLKCQTSDILTSSGKNVMHVFANNVLLKKL